MKKLVSLFLAVIMAFGMVVAIPANAVELEEVNVTLGSAKIEAGESFTLKLTADKILTAARARVEFDSTKFELTNVVMANGETNFNDPTYDQSVGSVQIFAIDLEDVTASFELDVTFEFTAKADIADGEYTFTVSAVDGDNFFGEDCETELAPVFTNGVVTVEEEEPAVPGDINGDGKFNYSDVSKLYAIFRKKSEAAEGVNTDINGDGKFNYSDVSKLYAIFRKKATFN